MKISVNKSEINGSTSAPSSNSYTIRGLMCAALARGESEIVRPLSSDDTEAALRVLSQIGVQTDLDGEIWRVRRNDFQVPQEDLFCGDSAATLRFMTAICSLIPGQCRLTAGLSLSQRPVKTLVNALQMWGVKVSSQGEVAPVSVQGGSLKGGIAELPGNISSQYVSALLLLAPLCERKSCIHLTAPLESVPYVLMTLECLQKFGVKVSRSDDLNNYEILPQVYQPARYEVEGDWSSASYLLALGAVAGQIQVSNLNLQSLQGDKTIIEIIKNMGASVAVTRGDVTVKKGKLTSIKTDLNNCIDLLPTVAVLAGLAEGTSELTGIHRARLKESNRVSSVRIGLEAAGIKVIEEPDRLIITGGKPNPAVIDSQNDHRIAMAFSLLGATYGEVTLKGAECVSKTYPTYWDTLRKLGVKLNEQ